MELLPGNNRITGNKKGETSVGTHVRAKGGFSSVARKFLGRFRSSGPRRKIQWADENRGLSFTVEWNENDDEGEHSHGWGNSYCCFRYKYRGLASSGKSRDQNAKRKRKLEGDPLNCRRNVCYHPVHAPCNCSIDSDSHFLPTISFFSLIFVTTRSFKNDYATFEAV